MYILLGILICIVIAYLLYSSINKDNAKLKESGVIIRNNEVTYVSGFDIFEGGQKIAINLTKDKLILIFNLTKQKVDIGSPFKKILIDDIIDAEIMTKEQLERDISLGKIILFGLMSLKNNTTVYSNYTVIKYKYNGQEKDLILQSSKNQEIVYNIKKLKNKEVV